MQAGRVAAGLIVCGALLAFQKPFRQYPGVEYDDFPLPSDWNEKTEFVFARLMYPPAPGVRGGGGYRGYRSDWREGGTMWTQDYPRADRHFSEAVRRLTRIHIRSVEQPVNLDDGDDVYNYPFLYAVQPGRGSLTDEQAAKMRDYLLRGGFFMTDDYWGPTDQAVFEEWMRRVFPDRPIVELDNRDSIFHTIYDLDDRYQVPGARYLSTGVTWKCEGFHETAPPVNRNPGSPSTQASIRILYEPIGAGSMQDKFRVEARRCHLSHELEAHSPRRSRQENRVFSTPPSQPKLTPS